MIFITGDTHGDFSRFSSKKFPEGKKLTKQDYIIITGDFGGIWDVNDSNPSETYNLKWLGQKPWTTLFIDGNHENFDRLNQFPEKEMFNDIVGVVNDSIFHLKRGKVYIINKLKFFTFGGGYSLDKDRRTPYIHWWPQELPNYTEYKLGLDNLVKYNNKVDYIITHSCSNNIFHLMSKKHYMTHKENDEELQLRNYLNDIYHNVSFKEWFCGHFHINDIFDKMTFLYENIKKIE